MAAHCCEIKQHCSSLDLRRQNIGSLKTELSITTASGKLSYSKAPKKVKQLKYNIRVVVRGWTVGWTEEAFLRVVQGRWPV